MSASPEKIALYCQGTFDIANPTPSQMAQMEADATTLANSGFGTILLGQWHVHSNGDIYYNNSILSSVMDNLQKIPAILKSTGQVKKVLISFGPFGSDFQDIQNNLASFESQMSNVIAISGCDGFDWDLEQDFSTLPDILVTLTDWANGISDAVTAAPYNTQSYWEGILPRVTPPGFAWWNLQLYGGASYSAWVGYLNGLVPDPQSFLVPGYSVVYGATPSQIQSDLAGLKRSFPNLDGGFIWKYEAIKTSSYTVQQYATAIANGLL